LDSYYVKDFYCVLGFYYVKNSYYALTYDVLQYGVSWEEESY
jgi:hypothetical protein